MSLSAVWNAASLADANTFGNETSEQRLLVSRLLLLLHFNSVFTQHLPPLTPFSTLTFARELSCTASRQIDQAPHSVGLFCSCAVVVAAFLRLSISLFSSSSSFSSASSSIRDQCPHCFFCILFLLAGCVCVWVWVWLCDWKLGSITLNLETPSNLAITAFASNSVTTLSSSFDLLYHNRQVTD